MIWTCIIMLAAIACIHSYFGERRLLHPLLDTAPVGILSNRRCRALLRGIWHLISVAWVTIAILLAFAINTPYEVGSVWVVTVLLILNGLVFLWAAGPTHLGAIGFILCSGLLLVDRLL
jgi:hypothetical protein